MTAPRRAVVRHGRRVVQIERGHVRDLATKVEFMQVHDRWHPRLDTWVSFGSQRSAFRALARAEAVTVLVRSMIWIGGKGLR